MGPFPGACLGGNGTLIGASANIIVAGYARKNQYPITFLDFLKIGYPIMLGTILPATFYLIQVHMLQGRKIIHPRSLPDLKCNSLRSGMKRQGNR